MRRTVVAAVLFALWAAPAHAAAPRILYSSDWSGSDEVYAVDPAHPGAMAQLTFGHDPACDPLVDYCGYSDVAPSPDGRKIAFVSSSFCGPRKIFVARADGRGRRLLARITSCSLDSLAWAPNSRRLAYVDNASVHTINADGSGKRMIGAGIHPAWSPDGRSLAFQRDRSLVVVRGGTLRIVADGVGEYAWAPNSKLIAVATTTVGPPYNAELEVVRPTEPASAPSRRATASS